ncbi:hypothetical protein CK934_14550 [Chitinophaga sp. MD30]|nr:hypothetical protein CK934_14550 [Chitinophaga sp. MD30]
MVVIFQKVFPPFKILKGVFKYIINPDSLGFTAPANHAIRVLITLLAEREVSISIASAFRLQSSVILSVLNFLPFTSVSLLK